jgi:energy-coupling factor transporter ATP-binding protein EcfA2
MSAVGRAIEARGLVRRYPGEGAPVRAVDGVDLVVETGEAVSVMGPSGCGKSTLLHLLGGLERPDAGELYLGGERAVGATPRQTVVAPVVSQLVACAIAVAAGIPLGLGLWSLMEGGDLPAVRVPATALVLLAAAVPVVFAAIVSVPARLLARRPVAPLLTYE